MEIMQLQPVRANLIYPNRNKANNPYIQTVEPIEVINTGIISTNPVGTEPISTREGNKLPFIEANTKEVTMQYLKEECITPVFSKDNEVTISHSSFIETAWEAANKVFSNERIEEPAIRVSHVIKGRIPEAIHKPVNQLLESDKTIYFERMMFCFEIPTIYEDIAGNRLNLTIGGVRAYNHMNLYSKKGAEKFKVFIGFKNLVCCNMCVSTDGFLSCLEVTNTKDLYQAVLEMFQSYQPAKHLHLMQTILPITWKNETWSIIATRLSERYS